MNLKGYELHGDMNQPNRIESYNKFKNEGGCLLATDIASRGLDFDNVDCVINMNLPKDKNTYVHRVGRTARAGKKGQCITILNEKELPGFKKIAKATKEKVFNRKIKVQDLEKLKEKVNSLQEDVEAILKEEKFMKELERAENEAQKA